MAGVTSGVGKTTIASGLIYALKKKGLKVQPFKVGPDFIDPGYHTHVSGRPSRNLDIWMMGKYGVIRSFHEASFDADVAVIEGVMGLFDGISGKNDSGSTAAVAKMLDAPIILVIDCSKAAGSIAAIALGFQNFDNKLKISGIILNSIAGWKHEKYIKDAFRNRVHIPILGTIRRNSDIKMDERHLGLIPTTELQDKNNRKILRSAKCVSEQIDIDKIENLWKRSDNSNSFLRQQKLLPLPKVRVAVAFDESFNFYYPDNLDALRKRQVELVYFSPVGEPKLPDNISGMLIGGGFPEILAKRLEENRSMISSIRDAAQDGLPIFAECGGLMYLTRHLYEKYKDGGEKKRKLIGLIDAETFMGSKLTLNYTDADCNGSILGNLKKIRGHEFHYSRMQDVAKDSRFAFSMKRGIGVLDKKDGFMIYNCLASYTHVHFSDRRIPTGLVQSFFKYARK